MTIGVTQSSSSQFFFQFNLVISLINIRNLSSQIHVKKLVKELIIFKTKEATVPSLGLLWLLREVNACLKQQKISLDYWRFN